MRCCIFIIIGVFFIPLTGIGGTDPEIRVFHPEERYDEVVLDSLERLFGDRKEVPRSYRRPFLIALSAYPELKKVPIRFVRGDLRTTMAARPVPGSLLAAPRARRFRILVDTLEPRADGKLFKELSLEARIGIMAHELAHILDYTDRGLGSLFHFGLRYLFKSSRRKIEARTDRIAVDRGFGWQLLAFKEHLAHCAELAPSYRHYKEQVYLSSDELFAIMEEHPDYRI